MEQYIERSARPRLEKLASQLPIVAITGPRQSGKSTLARMAFPEYRYVSLENPDMRDFALNDPRGFLATYDSNTVIDEAQAAPQLFSYLQQHVDERDAPGLFVLTGSQNFLLMESVTQSLAGRVALVDLLPLSQHELKEAGRASETLAGWLYSGAFPRIYRYGIDPLEYYSSYVQTYLERDIRSQAQVASLDAFRTFMRLCAGRVGSLLDVTGLASEAGIDVRTAKRWLSLMQASNVTLTVRPYFRNFKKRLVKRPKLYFCDTGLLCYLLGMRSAEDLRLSPFRGAVFENMVLLEYVKGGCAKGPMPDVWFWQETSTNEVDFIVGPESTPLAVEAKSGMTFDRSWFKSMRVFTELAEIDAARRLVVYGGDEPLETSRGRLVPWREWRG